MAEYTDEFKAETVKTALARIADGQTVLAYARELKLPPSTVYSWIEAVAGKSAHVHARRLGSYAFADQCVDISDDKDLDAQQKRVRIDTRMRLNGVFNRAEFGESKDLNVHISRSLNLEGATDEFLEELERRARAALPPAGPVD